MDGDRYEVVLYNPAEARQIIEDAMNDEWRLTKTIELDLFSGGSIRLYAGVLITLAKDPSTGEDAYYYAPPGFERQVNGLWFVLVPFSG